MTTKQDVKMSYQRLQSQIYHKPCARLLRLLLKTVLSVLQSALLSSLKSFTSCVYKKKSSKLLQVWTLRKV